MPRVNASAVREVIPNCSVSDTAMMPFIEIASGLVDYVVTQDTNSVLTEAMLNKLETLLAAYYYALDDMPFASSQRGPSSALFQGKWDVGFSLNNWGQAAMVTDVTGTLAKLNMQLTEGGKRKATVLWGGTTYT